MTVYAHIVGWGSYIPEKVVTNHDIAEFMDTSDEWIRERTGIRERRFVAENESTATIAASAARLALDRARIAPSAVDLIIVATLTPEHSFPSTASLVQDAIGANKAGAFDLSAACSGFIYGLSMGSGAIQSGMSKVVLVIGAETISRVIDKEDRSTYPLFGDGAGAVVLQAHLTPGGVMATVLGSDGSGAEHLGIPAGGSKMPATQETVDKRLHYVKMNGREVYRFATRVMGKVSKQACDRAGVRVEDIDLFIPHQANIRIIRSASKYLKISDDKVFTNLDKYGNTSAASIPIALCEAIEQGRVNINDKIVMVGFGGGLTWGASVVKWGVPMPYKRRQWWYRGVRWMVYRWARVRSMYMRLRRRVPINLDKDEELRYQPLVEEQKPAKKEKVKKPGSTEAPKKEISAKPVEKVPTVEKVKTNGNISHSQNGHSTPSVETKVAVKDTETQPDETPEKVVDIPEQKGDGK